MPAAKRPREGANVRAVKHDLAKLPEDLSKGALAAGALQMARELDDPNSSTSKSMCFGQLREALKELRELAPPAEKKGQLHDIKSGRALRLAAGSPRS